MYSGVHDVVGGWIRNLAAAWQKARSEVEGAAPPRRADDVLGEIVHTLAEWTATLQSLEVQHRTYCGVPAAQK
jgi:hypothetical protein